MNMIWLVRMARWVRNPPSKEVVMLVIGIVVSTAVLIGIEATVGWPDWLTVNGQPGRNQGVGPATPLN